MYFNKGKETKIYAYVPAGIVTGGVELMHQLVDVINSNGGNAFIVYYGEKKHEIPNDYRKYNLKLSDEIEDNNNNILVLPEANIQGVKQFKNIQIMIWWMSVDNYFLHYQASLFGTFNYFLRYGFVHALKCVIRQIIHYKNNIFSISQIRRAKNIICNAYQSEYAAYFLKKNGITNIYPLKDYINEEYIYNNSIENKDDIVLYNPKKGLKFTKKLIRNARDINWIPIQNMTRSQVKDLMSRAKLYIDFGYHPGKDRMPREAAMCGCCIITGKLGAAGFFGDLAINEDNYKFNQHRRDIPIIIQKIKYVLNNYEKEVLNFSDYRKRISQEKEEFEKSALELFICEK